MVLQAGKGRPQGWLGRGSWSNGKSKGKGAEEEIPQPTESDKLVISGLPPYMTDEMLQEIFGSFGTLVETKVLEDAKTSDEGSLESVARVRMSSQEEATKMFEELNGKIPDGLMEPVTMKYELTGVVQKRPIAKAHTIYVGDLPDNMDEDTFVSICGMKGTLVQAKVFPSKHCGYATFASEQEAQLAIEIVNGFEHAGATLSAKPADGAMPADMMSAPSKPPDPNMMRPHTNKLYVRGLKTGITDEEVLDIFKEYGAVEDVKILFSDEYTGSGAIVYMGSHWKAGELVQELDGVTLPDTHNPLRIKLADTPEEFNKRKAAQAAWDERRGLAGSQEQGRSDEKGKGTGKGETNAEAEEWEDPVAAAAKKRRTTKVPPRLPGMASSKEPELKVDGLPASADEWYLLKIFSKLGSLAGAQVNLTKDGAECDGSGYIKFVQSSGSEQAVASSGLPVADGTVLEVWPRWMAEPDAAQPPDEVNADTAAQAAEMASWSAEDWS